MIRSENYKRELAFIFFARKRMIVATMLALTTITVLIAVFWPPTYGVYSSILVKGTRVDRNPESLEDTQLRSRPVSEEDLYSEVAILTSTEVVRAAIAALDTAETAGVLRGRGATAESQMGNILSALDARVRPTSNLVEITLAGRDGPATKKILETILEQYLIYRQSVYNPPNVTAFLTEQVRRFENELGANNDKIADFIATTGVTAPTAQIESNLALRGVLMGQLNELEQDVLDHQATIDLLDKQLDTPDTHNFLAVNDPGVTGLVANVQALKAELEAAWRKFLPTEPIILRIQENLENAVQDLRAEVRNYHGKLQAELEVMEVKAAHLSAKIEALNAENVSLRQNAVKLQSMERRQEIALFSYETFHRRNEEALLSGDQATAAGSSYVGVLALPRLLPEALFPKPRLLIPFGIISGILLWISLGFFYEYLDHTFKRPEDLDKLGDIPLIFSLSADDVSTGKRRPGKAPAPPPTPPRREDERQVAVAKVVEGGRQNVREPELQQ